MWWRPKTHVIDDLTAPQTPSHDGLDRRNEDLTVDTIGPVATSASASS